MIHLHTIFDEDTQMFHNPANIYQGIISCSPVLKSKTFLRKWFVWHRRWHYIVSGGKCHFLTNENTKSQIFRRENLIAPGEIIHRATPCIQHRCAPFEQPLHFLAQPHKWNAWLQTPHWCYDAYCLEFKQRVAVQTDKVLLSFIALIQHFRTHIPIRNLFI